MVNILRWIFGSTEREETSLSPTFNARSLIRATRRTLKDNRQAIRDLKNIEGDTTRKDLAKLLRDLRKFENDTAHFEGDMKVVNLKDIKEQKIGIDQIQRGEDVIRLLKKIGVPPAVIANEQRFFEQLLENWETDIRTQLRDEEDLLKQVQALKRQNRAA